MIKIRRVQRKHEVVVNEYTGAEWIAYIETEERYTERVATLCGTIKEIISIQFLMNGLRIDGCIITYKE